ncbi:uncharacterized protein [Nothobranchius furzeri]|uniref:uncharacterized protein n=1 Tax=Nothobranchius furzeri TaxID=105023 RepID=UPI0039048090
MRIGSSKSESMVLIRKRIECLLRVRNEVLPQVEEFKYLSFLFSSEGKMERKIDRRIGAVFALMQALYRSVVVKRELSRKVKHLIYWSIYPHLDAEYRGLVRDFVAWSHSNHLQLNTLKTKELVVDFRRSREGPVPIKIEGEEVEVVNKYKYLGLWVDNKLDWSCNTDHLYKKAQGRLYFLWRLRSFNICRKLLRMFYESVVAGELLFAVVCWGSGTAKKDTSRLEKLIRKAGSVVDMKLDTLVSVAEERTLKKLLDIMDNVGHPLHTAINKQKSLFSERLLLPKIRTNRLKNSFVPHAVRLYNSSLEGRGRRNRRTKEGGGGDTEAVVTLHFTVQYLLCKYLC